MYSTLNSSKHANPYNFILWLFIDGNFFCCLKVRLKTGKETLGVERGPSRRPPAASRARPLPRPATGSHRPWPSFPDAASVSWEPFRLGRPPRGNGVAQETVGSKLLGVQTQTEWPIKVKSMKWRVGDKKTLKVTPNWNSVITTKHFLQSNLQFLLVYWIPFFSFLTNCDC